AIETSCNTFFYELGWRMEARWGTALGSGDGSERFQKYERVAGFDEPTGIDLPYEQDGVVPDMSWCEDNADIGYCPDGWLPGYTVNMAIGQGDLKVTPIQMATTYAAIANGGTVWSPRIGMEVRKPPTGGEGEEDLEDEGIEGALVRRVKEKKGSKLPLDETEIQVLREGLEQVIGGASGTARGAFAGFPLDQFPLAGKTGTAQRGDTGENDAWFISYGPTDDPRYVISVFVERAGHGGTTSAPIARQIWEGIADLEGVSGVDKATEVSLGSDSSG
ncbi:MAG: penicillin-binding transpeptidase domain-containing protein, partial [Actinomycetota bacterium]